MGTINPFKALREIVVDVTLSLQMISLSLLFISVLKLCLNLILAIKQEVKAKNENDLINKRDDTKLASQAFMKENQPLLS